MIYVKESLDKTHKWIFDSESTLTGVILFKSVGKLYPDGDICEVQSYSEPTAGIGHWGESLIRVAKEDEEQKFEYALHKEKEEYKKKIAGIRDLLLSSLHSPEHFDEVRNALSFLNKMLEEA